MKQDEQIAVVALRRVTFPPRTAFKRFARDMGYLLEHNPEAELTPKQRAFLFRACHYYRRQIDDPALVRLGRIYFNRHERERLKFNDELAIAIKARAIPTTVEEVMKAEKEMEGQEIELPESLREPPFHLLWD